MPNTLLLQTGTNIIAFLDIKSQSSSKESYFETPRHTDDKNTGLAQRQMVVDFMNTVILILAYMQGLFL